MMANEAQAVETKKKAPEVVLSWSVSLAGREGVTKTLGALVVMVGILALGAYLYGNVLLVTVGAVIFFLATAEYFFPMRFWLTEEAAFRRTVFGTKFIRWSRIKHCYLDDKGIKLSPLEGPSRTEAFRGLFLYFGNNRDELVEAVRDLAPGERG
jgi:hypothetical protein